MKFLSAELKQIPCQPFKGPFPAFVALLNPSLVRLERACAPWPRTTTVRRPPPRMRAPKLHRLGISPQKHRRKQLGAPNSHPGAQMWRVPSKRTLLALFLALNGCTSLVPLNEVNRAWLGRPLDELVAAWGPPVQSFKAEGGGSIHSWSMVIVKRRRSEECRRSVQVDKDGIIRRWLYDSCPRPQPRRSGAAGAAASMPAARA